MNEQWSRHLTFKNALKAGGVIFAYAVGILAIIVMIRIVIGVF